MENNGAAPGPMAQIVADDQEMEDSGEEYQPH
jgi:hypothetical protein